jgi:hypothetical protein
LSQPLQQAGAPTSKRQCCWGADMLPRARAALFLPWLMGVNGRLSVP